jgi:hypothetical protein
MRAEEAALEVTGSGVVIDRQAGDQQSAYEIEVILDDGQHMDVQLDRDFVVVDSDADSETDDVDPGGG